MVTSYQTEYITFNHQNYIYESLFTHHNYIFHSLLGYPGFLPHVSPTPQSSYNQFFLRDGRDKKRLH